MGDNGLYAVIPVKFFASAKQRMATFLSASERLKLARLMFEDVLDAARAARRIRDVLIVTSDVEVCRIAIAADVKVLMEDAESGYASAVASAAGKLRQIGAAGMVVIPSDIPQLRAATIDTMVDITASPGMTIVPASCDSGTNLLCMRPVDLVPPVYGPNSFNRHCMAARQAGIVPLVWSCPDAGRDLDRPDDLHAFLELQSGTRSHRFLSTLDLSERQKKRAGIPEMAVQTLEVSP